MSDACDLPLTDGKNQVTTWNYDEYGRATNKVDATSTEIFRYNFDPNGRLTNRWTAAKGNTVYRYDLLGSPGEIKMNLFAVLGGETSFT